MSDTGRSSGSRSRAASLQNDALRLELVPELQTNCIALLRGKSMLDERPPCVEVNEPYVVQVREEHQRGRLPLRQPGLENLYRTGRLSGARRKRLALVGIPDPRYAPRGRDATIRAPLISKPGSGGQCTASESLSWFSVLSPTPNRRSSRGRLSTRRATDRPLKRRRRLQPDSRRVRSSSRPRARFRRPKANVSRALILSVLHGLLQSAAGLAVHLRREHLAAFDHLVHEPRQLQMLQRLEGQRRRLSCSAPPW